MEAERREQIAKALVERSKADETEVIIATDDRALTRFTHNAIHQNLASANAEARIRVIVGGRTGVASANAGDERALGEGLERALELAGFAPADPLLPELPRPARYAPPAHAFIEATNQASPERQTQIADAIFAAATDGIWAAGYVATTRNGITISNSQSVMASFDSTDAACNAKLTATDSSGYAERFSHDVDEIDGRAIGTIAGDKARRSAHPRAVDPGDWTVILEPAAFGELLAYLTGHFSAQAYDEGSSFFSHNRGLQFAGENVTVVDDFSHPLHRGMPFDYEGTPTKRVALVERGAATGIVTDTTWAAKLGWDNTGHALPAPNAWGPHPRNVVVEAGSKSVEQLIAQTKRGLLISRFWYIRTVDQRKTIVTGMTRDGTFLIEDGELRGGVRNMRFNQSIIEALAGCEFSDTQARTGGYSYSIVVPAAKIERFCFTSLTDF
ncbi:MAG TPA: TldD/PmbA family protein [Candidatus Binatia bacterium]|nr:TldD/PmbA family protein [Candidatus Binatia bacterium]